MKAVNDSFKSHQTYICFWVISKSTHGQSTGLRTINYKQINQRKADPIIIQFMSIKVISLTLRTKIRQQIAWLAKT